MRTIGLLLRKIPKHAKCCMFSESFALLSAHLWTSQGESFFLFFFFVFFLDAKSLLGALFIPCSPHNSPARKKGQEQSRVLASGEESLGTELGQGFDEAELMPTVDRAANMEEETKASPFSHSL